jgi:hypothetical protein
VDNRVMRWMLVVVVGLALLWLLNVGSEQLRPTLSPDAADSSDGDVVGAYAYHVFPSAIFVIGYLGAVYLIVRGRLSDST